MPIFRLNQISIASIKLHLKHFVIVPILLPIITISILMIAGAGNSVAEEGDNNSRLANKIINSQNTDDLVDEDASIDDNVIIYKKAQAAFKAENYNDAILYWSRAADKKDFYSQWRLGKIYFDGVYVKKDYAKAFQYLNEVSKKHQPTQPSNPINRITVDALIALSTLYRVGVKEANLKANHKYSLMLLRHCASLFGHPKAQYELGKYYLEGEYVRQNLQNAYRWFLLSAQKNYAPAQAYLAQLFTNPRFGQINRAKSIMWLNLAINNNDNQDRTKQYTQNYNILVENSTPKEKELALRLINSSIAQNAGLKGKEIKISITTKILNNKVSSINE